MDPKWTNAIKELSSVSSALSGEHAWTVGEQTRVAGFQAPQYVGFITGKISEHGVFMIKLSDVVRMRKKGLVTDVHATIDLAAANSICLVADFPSECPRAPLRTTSMGKDATEPVDPRHVDFIREKASSDAQCALGLAVGSYVQAHVRAAIGDATDKPTPLEIPESLYAAKKEGVMRVSNNVVVQERADLSSVILSSMFLDQVALVSPTFIKDVAFKVTKHKSGMYTIVVLVDIGPVAKFSMADWSPLYDEYFVTRRTLDNGRRGDSRSRSRSRERDHSPVTKTKRRGYS